MEFNEAALKIAKRAASLDGQYVLATIGGIRGIRKSDATLDEILFAFPRTSGSTASWST